MESELAFVDLAVVYAVSEGRVEDQWEWIRTRECPAQVFATGEEAHRMSLALWAPDRVQWVRQLPALRLHTMEGCVLLVDVWGDARFARLRGQHGQHDLRIGTPLSRVLRQATSVTSRYRGPQPVVEIIDAGFQGSHDLAKGASLKSWASRRGHGNTVYFEEEWSYDAVPYNRAGLWSIVSAFRRVNTQQAVDHMMAQLLPRFEHERRLAASKEADDIARGIRDIENYLSQWE